jgi:hypothetical protein
MNNWIDCNERLPEPGEFVLACNADGGHILDCYIIARVTDGYVWSDVDYYDVSGITHWQPLPELPA